MKVLIEQYLSNQNVKTEPFRIQFLRYTTNLYQDNDGNWCLEFPLWRFDCCKPVFTSEEIENALKDEYIEVITDGIINKFSSIDIDGNVIPDTLSAEGQSKLDEFNLLDDLEDIKNFTY